jgi:uncharacterized protein YuzE
MTYDAEAKAAYVYLVDPIAPGEAKRQEVVLDGQVVLDLDEHGKLLGVEIIYADLLLRPETIARAERIG